MDLEEVLMKALTGNTRFSTYVCRCIIRMPVCLQYCTIYFEKFVKIYKVFCKHKLFLSLYVCLSLYQVSELYHALCLKDI